jgi:hypothetical protein
MTERPEREGRGDQAEETQTERVSGQPVDARAAIWKPGQDEDSSGAEPMTDPGLNTSEPQAEDRS